MHYSYKKLYEYAEEYIAARVAAGDDIIFVPVAKLMRQLECNIDWLKHIKIYPITDTDVDDKVWGMYEKIADQEAAYEPLDSHGVWIMHGQWQNWCYKRFVCCKEILHVFDDVDAVVSDENSYALLKQEIENFQQIETRPLEASKPMLSEFHAQWEALLLLCPKPEREKIILNGHDSDYAIAIKYRIPESLVHTLKSSQYEEAYKAFIEN